LSLVLTVVGRAGRLSHFSKPQHHDVVFLSSTAVVGGGAIVGFSFLFPFTRIEFGEGPPLITTLSVSTASETDPFCPGRGLFSKSSKAARMVARMTRVANKVRSTVGFARWVMIVKGPGSEESDGNESVSERPCTVSMAGSRRSIMMGE